MTGSNLSDKVADYVVKRGTVTLSLASVKLNDAKTEATLTSASSTIPAGDYTLTVGETTVNFTVVAEVVSEIVIDPEVAMLDGNDTQYAWTRYTVYNQFGEDITKAQYNAGNLTITGATVYGADPHWVKFDAGNNNDYTLNLSQVSLAVVCTKNGVNTSKILQVVEAAKLSEVTFKGLYAPSLTDGSVYVQTAMDVNSNIANYKLVFAAKDQYGFEWPNFRINTTDANAIANSINVNLSSVTGLTAGAYASESLLGDYAKYITVTLAGTVYGAGDVNVLAVLLKNGSTVSGNFTVNQDVMVDSLTITANSGVYGGQTNVLDFVALDQNGNAITDYATLNANTTLTGGNGTLYWDVKADGSAVLKYDAQSTAYTATQVLTVLTETKQFTTTSITVQPDRVPTAIIGIKATEAVGATTNGTVNIAPADFIVQDQYGNTMDWTKDVASGRKLAVTAVAGNTNNVFAGVATASAIDVATDAAIVAGTATATKGAVTVTVGLEAWNATLSAYAPVAGSDYTFQLYNVDVKNVSDFTIADIDAQYVTNTVVSAPAATVYGYYAGKKIALTAGQDYTVLSASEINPAYVYAPTATGLNYFDVKEGAVKVVINNAAGTEVTKTYKISGMPAAATTAYANPYFVGNVSATKLTAVQASALFAPGTYAYGTPYGNPSDSASVMLIADQYNKNFPGAVRYTISGATVAIVSGNNTDAATIMFYTEGYHTVNVKYTWANGYTYETTVVVNVQ